MKDKKHDHCEHHQGGNNFMLGAMLGGALALLISTKKGRAILKELSEKGIEALEDVKDAETLEQLKEMVMPHEPTHQDRAVEHKTEIKGHTEHHIPEEEKEKTGGVRRFFRGVKKK